MEYVYIWDRMFEYELISGEDYIKNTKEKHISHQLDTQCQNGDKSDWLAIPCMYTCR